MAFRYNKSYRIGKNFRVNVSKSGVGMSVGVKGLRVGAGPRGTRMTGKVPGTNIRFDQRSGVSHATNKKSRSPQQNAISTPQLPSPGIFAPSYEKDLVKGLNYYVLGNYPQALQYLFKISHIEPLAAIFSAVLMSNDPTQQPQAVYLLENLLKNDVSLPTKLMQKYVVSLYLNVQITPLASITTQVNTLAVILLLVELYQEQNRINEAIGLLEETIQYFMHPGMALSLCELYSIVGAWDGIIYLTQGITAQDDVTLSLSILNGYALQQKGLHEAAIQIFTDAIRKKKDRNPDLINNGRYWRALSYEATGKKSQARKEFEQLYALNPNLFDVAQRISN